MLNFSFSCDGGAAIDANGHCHHGRDCEGAIATDAAPEPREPVMLEIKMPEFANKLLQPSKRAMAEAELIQSFYEGRTFGAGEKLRLEYEARKLERSLDR